MVSEAPERPPADSAPSAGAADAAQATVATDQVFYDGDCGFCHRTVLFFLRRDPAGDRFRFAPLAGSTFERLIPAAERTELPDALAVRTRSGELLLGSDATVHLLRRLDGAWPLVGSLLAAVPRPLRERAYAAFARVRRKIFAPPEDACPVLPPHERARFDD